MPRKKTNSVEPPMATLRMLAVKYSRKPEEADDLVQDLFLAAIRNDRDITTHEFMPWAHGFIRNRAAFIARTEGRRRKREKLVHEQQDAHDHSRLQFPVGFIEQLSLALRKTARLINCGLNKTEIVYLLGISDPALRKRFSSLRKEWADYLHEGGSDPESHEISDSTLDNGLLRRALRNSFHGNPDKIIGSFDPDGHLLVFRSASAHKSGTHGNNTTKEER